MELLSRLGRSANRPVVAGACVAATAVVFSTLWFSLGADPSVPGALGVATMTAPTALNAFVAAALVWSALVPREGVWSYRTGVGAGIATAVLSHLLIGFTWVATVALLGTGTPGLGGALLTGAFYSAYSVPLTFGGPTVLSLGAALTLTYLRRRVDERPDSNRAVAAA